MQLQPKRPPGRADRKAAAYACDIVQLRAEGYTYEAIREALAEIGIALSETALRREIRRHQKRSASTGSGARPAPRAPGAPSLSAGPALTTGPPPPKSASGREIAEAYFSANPSNPLLPTKENS